MTPQEDLRAIFYEHYREAFEGYNRKPVTKYLWHLGVMLISVSLAHCSDMLMLT